LSKPADDHPRIDKVRPHAPPDPRQPARRAEHLPKLADHRLIVVSSQERDRQRQPAPARGHRYQVQQEYEQIVGVSLRGRQRFVVHRFKVDEVRAILGRIVDHIGHRPVAVRPRAFEVGAEDAVRAFELAGRRSHHAPSQCSARNVGEHVLARQFLFADEHIAARDCLPAVVEHAEAFHLASLPLMIVVEESDGNPGDAEEYVGD